MKMLVLSLFKLMLFGSVTGLFVLGQRILYHETLLYFWGNIIIYFLYIGVLFFTCKVFNSLIFGQAAVHELVISWFLCVIVTNTFAFFQLSLQALALLPVTGFLIIIAVQTLFIIPATLIINKLYYFLNPARKAIIIYGRKEKADDYVLRLAHYQKNFDVIKVVSQNETQTALLHHINRAESVFFLDVEEEKRDFLSDYCFGNNKRIYILPTFSGVLLHTSEISWVSRAPMFLARNPQLGIETRIIKRFIDIAVSLIAVIVTSPLMLFTAVAIRAYDRQPVIYKQTRVTRNEKHFTLYKFRSMRVDAEDDGVARLMSVNDGRVTPIGRVIRRLRIDELPQLFNILRGDMSLVGPRPERPEIIEQYKHKYPNFAYRLKVKAGLTGFAQVFGNYNTSPGEKLILDIMYIEQFSIWQDLKLLMQTVKVLFLPSSTVGVEGTTALFESKTRAEASGAEASGALPPSSPLDVSKTREIKQESKKEVKLT